MTVLSDRTAPTAATTGVRVLQVTHELDIATLPQLRQQLEDALAERPSQLVLDLSECRFLDAQAMTVLLDVHRQAWRQGGLLTLRGCSTQCQRLLALAGLAGVFDVEPTVEAPAPRVAS